LDWIELGQQKWTHVQLCVVVHVIDYLLNRRETKRTRVILGKGPLLSNTYKLRRVWR